VFWFALGAAILIGLMLFIIAVLAVKTRGAIGIADIAVSVFLIFGPYAALAWYLSRPSAKTWFTPTAVP